IFFTAGVKGLPGNRRAKLREPCLPGLHHLGAFLVRLWHAATAVEQKVLRHASPPSSWGPQSGTVHLYDERSRPLSTIDEETSPFARPSAARILPPWTSPPSSASTLPSTGSTTSS